MSSNQIHVSNPGGNGFIYGPKLKPNPKESSLVNSLKQNDALNYRTYHQKTNYGTININRNSKGAIVGTSEFHNLPDGRVLRVDKDNLGKTYRSVEFNNHKLNDTEIYYNDKGLPTTEKEFKGLDLKI
jgi:hypothetical protein